jgi:DNA polymerase III epsilon subunit-like protein
MLEFFKAKKSRFSNRKIFWFDVETSGTDLKLHGIVQIACLIEVDGKIVDQFESKMRLLPGKEYDPKALEVTGFTAQQVLKDFPDPIKVYKELRTFVSKHGIAGDKENRFIMAGYNANKFDCDMLSEHIKIIAGKYAYWDFFQFKPIDIFSLMTMLSYAGLIDVENEKLSTIAEYFGVEIDAHDALSDIKATREITIKVMSAIYAGLSGLDVPLLGFSKENTPCSQCMADITGYCGDCNFKKQGEPQNG